MGGGSISVQAELCAHLVRNVFLSDPSKAQGRLRALHFLLWTAVKASPLALNNVLLIDELGVDAPCFTHCSRGCQRPPHVPLTLTIPAPAVMSTCIFLPEDILWLHEQPPHSTVWKLES